MKRVGIIGYPVGHSLSPRFQQVAFDHFGMDVTYEVWETLPNALFSRVASLRSDEYLGANVTVPYKEAVVPILDNLSEEASLLGAVNTIVHRDGKLTGQNTDGIGFLQALCDAEFDVERKKVLILGAGGAARAVAFALARGGVTDLYIANRNTMRGDNLAMEVNSVAPIAFSIPLTEQELAGISGKYDLLVNTTSVGMRYTETDGRTPFPKHLLTSKLLVNDLVYNPPETTLLKDARDAGADTLGGLGMLVNQGAASFEIWTAMKAPIDLMLLEAERGLR
jgi:shikimate dehydrogenase